MALNKSIAKIVGFMISRMNACIRSNRRVALARLNYGCICLLIILQSGHIPYNLWAFVSDRRPFYMRFAAQGQTALVGVNYCLCANPGGLKFSDTAQMRAISPV